MILTLGMHGDDACTFFVRQTSSIPSHDPLAPSHMHGPTSKAHFTAFLEKLSLHRGVRGLHIMRWAKPPLKLARVPKNQGMNGWSALFLRSASCGKAVVMATAHDARG